MNDSHYTSLIQAKKVMELLLKPELKRKKNKRKRKYYYK